MVPPLKPGNISPQGLGSAPLSGAGTSEPWLMDLPTREAGTPRGVSDGSSYKSSSRGLCAPLATSLCPAAQGVAPQILPDPA